MLAMTPSVELKKVLDSSIWVFDNLVMDPLGKKIHGSGTACPPVSAKDFGGFFFTFEGKKYLVEDLEIEELRNFGKSEFHKLLDNRTKHFKFTFKHDKVPQILSDGFAMDFGSKESLEPYKQESTWYYMEDALSIPPEKNIFRVAGSGSIVSFRMVGLSAFVHLDTILKKYFQKSIEGIKNICDWGCGCGRLTRYLTKDSSKKVTGLDIDGDNILWCKQNIPNASFTKIKTDPPVSLKDNSFDLIIGISIFTHLTEARQFRWLEELKRLSKPESIVLVTINSHLSWAVAKPSGSNDFEIFEKKGNNGPF